VKIKQQHLKIIIISIVISMLCGSYVVYDIYVNAAKHKFRSQITTRIQTLLTQHQAILRQLSQSILDPIKNQDIATIVTNIRAYEDVLFTFSKSGLGLPVRIHFVSLSAPQQILGSNGKSGAKALVPDQNYYIEIMNNPAVITLSGAYEELAMPGFLLCNWGLGVLDHDANFHGQLDVQTSVNALQDYLATNNLQNFRLFSFKLNADNISQPDILMDRRMYMLGLFCVWAVVILSMLLIGGTCKLIYGLYSTYKQQRHNLSAANDSLNKLNIETSILKSSRQVQYKYGILAANDASVESLIDLQQLLQDAYAVNAEDAVTHNVTVVIPLSSNHTLRFYGNRLRLMQILSGIIGEGINVLPANSVITLQVEVIQVQDNLQQIIFKFHDNGFYSKLEHRQVLASNADVRVLGWDNINYLIDLELGELQHVHTAYAGNTIILSITRKLEQKVFNIENYV
jgi:hypothetical protein